MVSRSFPTRANGRRRHAPESQRSRNQQSQVFAKSPTPGSHRETSCQESQHGRGPSTVPKTAGTSKRRNSGEQFPNTLPLEATQLVAFNDGSKPVRSQVGSKEPRVHSTRRIAPSKSKRIAPKPQAIARGNRKSSTQRRQHAPGYRTCHTQRWII